MKKLVILTSILALSACGGGSGTGSLNNPSGKISNISDIPGIENPIGSLTTEQSNKVITGMLNGEDINGEKLELDKVKFKVNLENNGNYYTFKVNTEGKIEGIKDIRNYPVNNTELYKRYENSNVFVSEKINSFVTFDNTKTDIELLKIISYSNIGKTIEELISNLKEAVNNSSAEQFEKDKAIAQIDKLTLDSKEIQKFDNKNIIRQKMYGKDLGLKYSDFGSLQSFIQIKSNKIGDNISPSNLPYNIFGGYDERKIDKSDIHKKMIFRGKAVGRTYYFKRGMTYQDSVSATLNLEGSAKLTFDPTGNSSEKLEMSFNNWYDVEVNKEGTNGAKIKFTNKNDNTIDEKFKFTENVQNDIDGLHYKGFETEYYKDYEEKPSEVVGKVGYNIEDGNIHKDFYVGFGAKKE